MHLKCLPSVCKLFSVYTQRDTNRWFCSLCTEDKIPFDQIYDEDDFIGILSESWNSRDILPDDLLQSQDKLFSPFELNENHNMPLREADPDMNFYRNQCNFALQSCDYYLVDSFNNKNLPT